VFAAVLLAGSSYALYIALSEPNRPSTRAIRSELRASATSWKSDGPTLIVPPLVPRKLK